MFRRHWSSLPRDVSFPSGLEALGYFVNEEDEIRSIENPDFYFKYFINRNPRINARQRFEFNIAMEEIIHERLEGQELQKLRLPLGTPVAEPHTPIFASNDITERSRVTVVLGEPVQDLGILAGRVANGPGGLNKGSMVSVVQEIQKQCASGTDKSPPGIIIANPGQLYWWPDGKRALTVTASAAIPLPSLVHSGRRYDPAVNSIAGNEDPQAHVTYIFDQVLSSLACEDAKIDIVAIGQSCELVMQCLDDAKIWSNIGQRLSAMLLFGSVYPVDGLTNGSLKHFLATRTRDYGLSSEPVETPLAPPSGNDDEQVPALGCPLYSSSEGACEELILIAALQPALQYLQDVAATPDYENDLIVLAEKPRQEESAEEVYDHLSEEQKPAIQALDGQMMKEQVKIAKHWRRFAENGVAPDTDSEDDEFDF